MARRLAPKKRKRVTRGGRKLDKYLASTGIGIVKLANQAGVSRVSIRQVINGERWKHISVGFALRIARVTGGKISVEDFDYSTVPDDKDDQEEPVRTGTEG